MRILSTTPWGFDDTQEVLWLYFPEPEETPDKEQNNMRTLFTKANIKRAVMRKALEVVR
tara:strand:- start:18616 stop:18792 length:177 start_codon:yes stop_codon:yes gene_type:complete